MKNLLLSSVSLLALCGVASGADMPLKAAPAPVVLNWAGFYAGIQGGIAASHGRFVGTDAFVNAANTATSADKTGGIAGVNAGYNFQSGNFVYGVEADWNWVGAKASTAQTPGFAGRSQSTSFDVRWLATARARLGIVSGPVLFYATGGVAFAGVRDNATVLGNVPLEQIGSFDTNKTKTGWTLGGGLEYMIAPRWTVRVEGRYVDLGKSSVTCAMATPCNNGGAAIYRGEFRNSMVTGLVGIDYKF